ncbi:DUF948 domain-containing protein [Paenibacillus sp. GSMTC-2017]|uniref:DUF948 domain-containing protein n=1 Tax=Paenibacillus sp. GSMTC-2017 TaxID=2794350 RepID=UPI0018D7A70C|nr:DUF948 domain-containing protein [Paenibacillus sp. GSMTC-2017]MBH5319956.1 DUF948 domain-containing protein [Paenibacillus sp. GSMTC-2017]
MDTIIGVCAVVITLAVLLLLYAVYNTLKLAGKTMEEASITMVKLRSEIIEMSLEAKEIVQQTGAVTQDVRDKLKELDGLFQSVSDIGEVTQTLTATMKEAATGAIAGVKASNGSVNEVHAEENKIVSAIADGVASTLRIWNRLKQN